MWAGLAARMLPKSPPGDPPGPSRGAPGDPPGGPRRPQEPPRATQDGPKSRQERPKSSQESSKKPFRIPLGPHRPPGGLRGGILESFWEHFRTNSASVFEHSAPHFQRLPLTCFRHLRFLLFSFSSVPHAKEELTQSRNKSITCPEDTQRSNETHAKCG